MLNMIKVAAAYIAEKAPFTPEVGIILGTGLGGLVEHIDIKLAIPYEEIPNFPVSTVEGHSGRLIFGLLGGKQVVAMQGRFHYYEGYTPQQVVFPVRVMKMIGIQTLFVSNAAGGMNSSFRVGDVMVITDHINLIPNPLVGKRATWEAVHPPSVSQSVQFSHSVVSNSLQPHELQHARPPCPPPTHVH